MKNEKCKHCDGTGYGSAARASGDPNQIGIWRCDYCAGTGKRSSMYDVISQEEIDHMTKRFIYRLNYLKSMRNK